MSYLGLFRARFATALVLAALVAALGFVGGASAKTAIDVKVQRPPAVDERRSLGVSPTDDELMRVSLFAQPLIPVGATNPEENNDVDPV